MTRALFNVTYEIITPDSSAEGCAEDQGFILESASLRDAVKRFNETRTNRIGGVQAIEANQSGDAPRWITVYNGTEYETGAQEMRSLHIPASIRPSSARRIARLCGVTL